jgi:RecB family exonuclease
LDVEGVPVTGKIDRVDRFEDGRLSVLDYKTGKSLAVDRIQTDSQLTMYQMACEELLKTQVARLTFYHLPTHREHTVGRRDDSQVEQLRRRIVQTAVSITKELFEPAPTERGCQWCDYKSLCPVFSSSAPGPAASEDAMDERLAALIDAYGDLRARADEAAREEASLRRSILDVLRAKGYVRAFGERFEVHRSGNEKWEFPEGNKKKVLHALKEAGLYEKVLAPSAPLIQKVLSDPKTPACVREDLQSLGSKQEACELKVSPL